ncbi:MAG: hypothetical protein AAGB05_01660 [Pseudomonadota bacterium]
MGVGLVVMLLRRLVRRVMVLLTIAMVATGMMRHVAPHPDEVYGGVQIDAGLRLSPSERLYRLLYDAANTTRFPVFESLWVNGPTHPPPAVGTPGHGETAMGKSLSDLRTRLVGGPSDPVEEKSLFDAIEYELTRPDWVEELPPGPGVPPAEAKRLRVGE